MAIDGAGIARHRDERQQGRDRGAGHADEEGAEARQHELQMRVEVGANHLRQRRHAEQAHDIEEEHGAEPEPREAERHFARPRHRREQGGVVERPALPSRGLGEEIRPDRFRRLFAKLGLIFHAPAPVAGSRFRAPGAQARELAAEIPPLTGRRPATAAPSANDLKLVDLLSRLIWRVNFCSSLSCFSAGRVLGFCNDGEISERARGAMSVRPVDRYGDRRAEHDRDVQLRLVPAAQRQSVRLRRVFRARQRRAQGRLQNFTRPADSGKTLTNYFCPNCGTNIAWEAEIRPGWIGVAVGAFADPDFRRRRSCSTTTGATAGSRRPRARGSCRRAPARALAAATMARVQRRRHQQHRAALMRRRDRQRDDTEQGGDAERRLDRRHSRQEIEPRRARPDAAPAGRARPTMTSHVGLGEHAVIELRRAGLSNQLSQTAEKAAYSPGMKRPPISGNSL